MSLLAGHFNPKPNTMNAAYVTTLLTLAAMNSAFCNVVVNALMVAQARRDTKNGSSDL